MKTYSTVVLTYLLLTLSAYSSSCEFYFLDHKSMNEKIYQTTQEQDIVKLFSQFNLTQKVDLYNAIDNLNSTKLERLIRDLKTNPTIFESYNKISVDRILLDTYSPGYSALSSLRANKGLIRKKSRFSDIGYKWKVPSFKANSQLKTQDYDYRDVMVEINKLFNDNNKVFQRMQQFEDRIMRNTYDQYPNFKNLDQATQAQLKEDQMIKVLNELEIKHGFQSASPKRYQALELENKEYTLKDWQEMLREGKIFNDTNFKEASSVSKIIERESHGYYTHRIQWHIVLQEIDAHPQAFKNFKGVDIYKKIGDMDFNKNMGLARTDEDTLWQSLFDTFTNTYHSPEYFREMHELYPELGAWL